MYIERPVVFDIAGIIPAAGQSKRLGKDKRMLPWGEMTVLESSAKTLVESGCSPVVVVLEPDSPCKNLSYLVEEERICVVSLIKQSPSMVFTIIQGLNFLPEKTLGVAVLPGDCPRIPVPVVNMLNYLFAEQKPDLIIPTFQGKQGHPRYVSLTMFDSLRQTDPGGRFSSLFNDNSGRVLRIEVNNESIVSDIDTPTGYALALRGEK